MSSGSPHTWHRAHCARSIRKRQASLSTRRALSTPTSVRAMGTSLATGVHGEQSKRSSSPTLRSSDSAICRTRSSCSVVPARSDTATIGSASAHSHSCGGAAGFSRWAASRLVLLSMRVVHYTCHTATQLSTKCSRAQALTASWSNRPFGTFACSSSARSQGGGGVADQHGQSAPLARPQLGSCASSGRPWRLWAAQHSQEEAGPLGAQPLP